MVLRRARNSFFRFILPSDLDFCTCTFRDGFLCPLKVVLNKSDTISHQQLMKVYGALLWSLGKVIDTPEVTRVYIGSFWAEPLKNEDTAPLLEMEMVDLLRDLAALPRMEIGRAHV